MQVAPLPQFSAGDLAALLDEEVLCWREELDWDYRPAAEAIAKCLNSRSLQGHALREPAGPVVGYCYHVIDGRVGYIGNFFIRRQFACRESYRLLLQAALADLRRTLAVKRIECQFVPFNCDVADLFRGEAFEAVNRRFMARPLGPADRAAGATGGRNPVGWNPAYLRSAARVIRDSYRSSRDYDLCVDYQSLRGVLRFLRNLIENSGCGVFCPRTSMLGFDGDGEAAAVLLSSRIGFATHMIPQLSVAPERQNQGWGTSLLRAHFSRALGAGSTQTLLCVSDCNEGATRLYRRLGFQDRKQFYAFIWKAD